MSVQCEGSEDSVQMSMNSCCCHLFILKTLKHFTFRSKYIACALGILTPQTVQCTESIVASQKTREIEYLGEVEFVSSNQDVASILSGFSKINEKFGRQKGVTVKPPVISGSYYQHSFGQGKPCGMPKKDLETIYYK